MFLAAAIVFACGVDGRSHEPDVAGPPLPQPPAEVPVVSRPAVRAPEPIAPEPTATSPEGSEPIPTMPSLEDLLRLPASVTQAEGGAKGLKPNKSDDVPSANGKQGPGRVRVDVNTRNDRATIKPSSSRDRTDAGVSVGVSETIRLRGGVRLEEGSGKESQDPVPTVGIEKRF